MTATLPITEELPADHASIDAHLHDVGGDHLGTEQATPRALPRSCSPARPNFPADQDGHDAHAFVVGGETNGSGHVLRDAQPAAPAAPASPDPATGRAAPTKLAPGPGTTDTEQAIAEPTTKSGAPAQAPHPAAPAMADPEPNPAAPVLAETDDRRGPAKDQSSPTGSALGLADPLLALAADVLDDLERVRIANENRLRQLTRAEADVDGLDRGFGLPLDHPDVTRQAAIVLAFLCDSAVASTGKTPKKAGCCLEHDAERNLAALLRKNPLGGWVKQARGVGPKQGARLLASIGDPYFNTLHNRPRTVSELWAYAGYHVLPAGQTARDSQGALASGGQTGGDPDHPGTGAQAGPVGVAATRVRNHKVNWSPTAKMRAHLVAVSILKAGGPYRDVYDATRAKYDGALHQVECRRCGPAGKPAQVGSPLSAGHQHARALRAVAKTVLRDLWREAKRIHEQNPPG